MSASADFVVAGAGHNSLITAAYLARAGYEVLVLDARPIPGGGAASEEMLGPGYSIDSCSTGHTLIQTNPLLIDDELDLIGRYGLTYIEPDPFSHVAFPDGEQLTMWLDRERSVEELERFSRADARAYERLLDDYDAVKHLFGASRFTPPGFGPPLEALLADHPEGSKWRRRLRMSAWDVIRHEFESPYVRSFMLWQAFQTLVPVDAAGSGPLAYSIVFGRQRRGWTIPRGGSGELTEALVRSIVDDGGTVLCDRVVSRLLLEDGRCVGVETEAGETFSAREAVVSTIHVKHLVEMAPADAWGEDFVYGVETYDVGLSGFAVYMAATRPPVFETPAGDRTAVSAGLIGWPQELLDHGRRLRDGVYDPDPAWLLVATPTLADPSRAPEGRHTVKFLSGQGWRLPEGESGWDRAQAAPGPAPARARAPVRALVRRGRRARDAGQVAVRHRGLEPPHDPRRLPRRRPRTGAIGGPAAGPGLGTAPDADRGALPDRRHDASGRLDHRRPRAQRGRRDPRRPRSPVCRPPGSAARGDARMSRAIDAHAHVIVREITRNGHPGRGLAPAGPARGRADGGRARRARDPLDGRRGGRRRDACSRLSARGASTGSSSVRSCRCCIADAEPAPASNAAGSRTAPSAALVAADPGRISALGAVPLQDPELAAEELLALAGRGGPRRGRDHRQRRGRYVGDAALRTLLGGGVARAGCSSSSTRPRERSSSPCSAATTCGTRSATRSRPRSRRRR